MNISFLLYLFFFIFLLHLIIQILSISQYTTSPAYHYVLFYFYSHPNVDLRSESVRELDFGIPSETAILKVEFSRVFGLYETFVSSEAK